MQLMDLKLKVSTAEQEREFYFNKLRDIEILCQMEEIKTEPVRPQTSPKQHMHPFRSLAAHTTVPNCGPLR